MALLRTFKYRSEVHSENLVGNVESWLCDNASLSSPRCQLQHARRMENLSVPFQLIFDYVHNLVWKSLNSLVTQVDGNPSPQFHTINVRRFCLILPKGILHCLSSQCHDLPYRYRNMGRQGGVGRRMLYSIRRWSNRRL